MSGYFTSPSPPPTWPSIEPVAPWPRTADEAIEQEARLQAHLARTRAERRERIVHWLVALATFAALALGIWRGR